MNIIFKVIEYNDPKIVMIDKSSFLVDQYDYQGFADRIVEILKNKSLAKAQMRGNVQKIIFAASIMDDYLKLMCDVLS